MSPSLPLLAAAPLEHYAFLAIRVGGKAEGVQSHFYCLAQLLLVPGNVIPSKRKAQSMPGMMSYCRVGNEPHEREHTSKGNSHRRQPSQSLPTSLEPVGSLALKRSPCHEKG